MIAEAGNRQLREVQDATSSVLNEVKPIRNSLGTLNDVGFGEHVLNAHHVKQCGAAVAFAMTELTTESELPIDRLNFNR